MLSSALSSIAFRELKTKREERSRDSVKILTSVCYDLFIELRPSVSRSRIERLSATFIGDPHIHKPFVQD